MRTVWSAGIAAVLVYACNSTDSSVGTTNPTDDGGETHSAGNGGNANGGRSGNAGSDMGKAGAAATGNAGGGRSGSGGEAGDTGGAGAVSGTGGQSGAGSGARGGSAGQVGGNSGSGGSGGNSGSGDAGSGGNAGDACSSDTPVWPPAPRQEMTTNPVETTSCPSNPNDGFSPVNACGCDDLVCATEEMCILVVHPSPSGVGGPDRPYNGCFDLCESNDDCAAPEVCIENLYGLPVCSLPECLTDGDCTAEPCGQCIPGYLIAHGGQVYSDPTSSFCVYEGSCASAACSSCIQHNLGEPNPDWYSCQ